MHNFRQLNIWKDARAIVKDVYLLTSKFPVDERFGLISQINRCAISVPSNIAEGSARGTNKDFAHFLKMSLGSLYELETQLFLAADLNMISESDEIFERIIILQKMVVNFIKTLKEQSTMNKEQ
ncbi:four helix bundle protein [Pedobacter aquae]|uniref:Four helix bundle protein n=1 Tax=Pedobacter aquae TaxID=2605747 RepID=A0A5C0VMV9_9SPHI|nr:four helix bundle protein [Pedobacter aquae]QEK52951.1 four helix bundle protein [Pedobacter aquae]